MDGGGGQKDSGYSARRSIFLDAKISPVPKRVPHSRQWPGIYFTMCTTRQLPRMKSFPMIWREPCLQCLKPDNPQSPTTAPNYQTSGGAWLWNKTSKKNPPLFAHFAQHQILPLLTWGCPSHHTLCSSSPKFFSDVISQDLFSLLWVSPVFIHHLKMLISSPFWSITLQTIFGESGFLQFFFSVMPRKTCFHRSSIEKIIICGTGNDWHFTIH